MEMNLRAEHGIICRVPGEKMGYFGWPTVARLDDGTLVVGSSGLRSQHVCPWGKTVLNTSTDEGRTWSAPHVINDSLLDDRDVGVVNLGGRRMLVTWFTTDNHDRLEDESNREWLGDEEVDSWREPLAMVTDDIATKGLGSWLMVTQDAGATWSPPLRVPVSSPHGPIRLRNGHLLYLGKPYESVQDMRAGMIQACRSLDDGRTWQVLGRVPLFPKTVGHNYHEPHVVELPSGKLIGAIRAESDGGVNLKKDAGVEGGISIMMTGSADGGLTWSQAQPLNFHGSPPHLLRHSSGVLIMTYGYRLAPFGQRVAFSRDEGATWEHDWILREDGPDWDLGYPSTVEMADGHLFTAYYQKAAAGEKCSLLWSRWQLPTEA